MAKLSIITLTYNGLHVLKNCIESVLEQCADQDFEWIIRENGSTDGTVEYLKELAEKDDRLFPIQCTNEGSFSQMNNEMLEYCSGDYVLFLNNDVQATSNFIKEMLEVIENDEEVGAVGAVLRYPDDTIQHCGIVYESNCTAHNISTYYMAIRDLKKDLYLKDREYQGATGACLMMRTEDWEAVGLFDESFHWCYDDVDLCLKVVFDLGKKIVVPCKATLYHFESWSKANPNVWAAVSRLGEKWAQKLSGDVYWYTMDYNEYHRPTKG